MFGKPTAAEDGIIFLCMLVLGIIASGKGMTALGQAAFALTLQINEGASNSFGTPSYLVVMNYLSVSQLFVR